MSPNNTTSSDETVVNSAYAAITYVTASNNETLKLQSNPAYASSNIINGKNATSSANGNETIKLQQNPAYVTISDLTASRDEMIVQRNPAYTVNTAGTVSKKDTTATTNEPMKVQRSPEHAAISENITTNGDETIVNPAYTLIRGNPAGSDEAVILQRSPVHSAITEYTNSSETIENTLYSQVDDKHTTAGCSDKTEMQRNPSYATAIDPSVVHLYEEIPDSRTTITNISKSARMLRIT